MLVRFLLLTLFLSSSLIAVAVPSSETTEMRPFTHGNVQITLKRGLTTQLEVLNAFGPPNIMTIDGEQQEIWTYQKAASSSHESYKSNSVVSKIFVGDKETIGLDSSQKTMMLLIKFGADKVVKDFRSMSTIF